MDPPGYGQPDQRRRAPGRHSVISIPPSLTPRPQELSAYHSNIINQFSSPGVPTDHRRRDRNSFVQNMPSNAPYPDPLFAGRVHPRGLLPGQPQHPQGRRQGNVSPGVRLENMESHRVAGRYGQQLDLSAVYPQMSPYDDHHRSISTPENFGSAYRTMSQPGTPAVDQPRRRPNEPSLHLNPRVPTYPPVTHRHSYHPASYREVTFSDNHDFGLFAEATAGLGPEEFFQQTDSPASSHSTEKRTGINTAPEPMRPRQMSSPAEPTPTTMFALQQLAQMPQGSRIQTEQRSSNNIEEWIQSVNQSEGFNLDEDEDGFMEDELPDYAASQAQAQAVQRVEATRRAQELQRRWQQSRRT